MRELIANDWERKYNIEKSTLLLEVTRQDIVSQ